MAAPVTYVKNQNRWLALGLIWLVFIVHGVDRSVLLVLLEPIRKTFGLSDSELGLLVGLGYALPLAFAGIPLGAMVDRVPKRKYFLAGLLVVWSCLTALGGLAPSFVLLVLSRAGVGASESGAPPAMMSILSDTFDAKTRPAALSVYYTAPFLGLMLGAILAGRISQLYGWRDAVLSIGIPGIIMAVVTVIFLREPNRGRFDRLPALDAVARPAPVFQTLLHAFREPALRQIILAITLAGFVIAAISSWTPVLMERVLGFSLQRTGNMLALIAGLPAVLGLLTGGATMTLFGKASAPRLLRFSGVVLLIGTPMVVLAPLCHSTSLTLTLLFGWSFPKHFLFRIGMERTYHHDSDRDAGYHSGTRHCDGQPHGAWLWTANSGSDFRCPASFQRSGAFATCNGRAWTDHTDPRFSFHARPKKYRGP